MAKDQPKKWNAILAEKGAKDKDKETFGGQKLTVNKDA